MLHRVIYIGLFVSVFIFSHSMGQSETKIDDFKISSPVFGNNGNIPSEYTCDGENVNPPIKFKNVPPEAKSLALIFDDMDAPKGSYVHWILWNIDPNIKEIKENSVPEGAIQGTSDFKKHRYGGPCPPRSAHRYVLKIYALDSPLHLNPDSTKADLEKTMKGHVLAQAEWIGVYKRVSASQK